MYEFWDVVSGNVIGAFASEAEALAVVRDKVAKHSAEAVADWAMAPSDAEDDARTVLGAAMLQASGARRRESGCEDSAAEWG